jgi:hypothetical protein
MFPFFPLTDTSEQWLVCFPCSSSVSVVELEEQECVLRPTVSRAVRLGIGLPFGTHDQFLYAAVDNGHVN